MSKTIRFTIRPEELSRKGAPLGVAFRTGAHDRKRKNAKRDRRAFQLSKSRQDW